MRTSIATVCLSGTLDQKPVAAYDAGLDASIRVAARHPHGTAATRGVLA